jgi:hypothetical protein
VSGAQRGQGPDLALVWSRTDDEHAGHPKLGKLDSLLYSLTSGSIATAAGAAISLAASGTARLAVWCSVTCVVSVAAGLVRESGPVSACWLVCRRLLGRFSGLRSFS